MLPWRNDLRIMVYLDVIATFEIAFYSLVTLLFVLTGSLNIKDLQALRQEKWTRQDTVAVMLRTLFFSSLLNFILIVATTGGILVFISVFKLPISLRQILPIGLLSLEFSFAVLVVTGIVYGIARWKDWYDLIDAED
jgi:hypothetical protein